MSIHIHIHTHPDEETAERLRRIDQRLGAIENNTETMMADIADIKPALDAIDVQVAKVKTDVDTLIAKLGAVPTAGLTPEQQAAIDDAVAHANGIATALGAIDAAATVTT